MDEYQTRAQELVQDEVPHNNKYVVGVNDAANFIATGALPFDIFGSVTAMTDVSPKERAEHLKESWHMTDDLTTEGPYPATAVAEMKAYDRGMAETVEYVLTGNAKPSVQAKAK